MRDPARVLRRDPFIHLLPPSGSGPAADDHAGRGTPQAAGTMRYPLQRARQIRQENAMPSKPSSIETLNRAEGYSTAIRNGSASRPSGRAMIALERLQLQEQTTECEARHAARSAGHPTASSPAPLECRPDQLSPSTVRASAAQQKLRAASSGSLAERHPGPVLGGRAVQCRLAMQRARPRPKRAAPTPCKLGQPVRSDLTAGFEFDIDRQLKLSNVGSPSWPRS